MKSIAVRLLIFGTCMRFGMILNDYFWGNGDIVRAWKFPYSFLVIPLTLAWATLDAGLPMRKIYKAMNRFKAGQFDERIVMHRKDEIGLIAETFNQLADRVQSMIESERRMTANLAHEIRMPITRIAYLLDKIDCNAKSAPARDQIKNEIIELSLIAQQLLKLAQIERSEFKPNSERINLNDFVSDLLNRLQFGLEKKSLNLIFLPFEKACVIGDASLLKIAVLNILENAIHYTDSDSTIEIIMTLDNNSGPLKLSVKDQGPGVPPEDLERIFLPFERSDQSRDRQTGGTGLGLSLAKSIINCQNGSIQARNLANGFEISILLPIAPDSFHQPEVI